MSDGGPNSIRVTELASVLDCHVKDPQLRAAILQDLEQSVARPLSPSLSSSPSLSPSQSSSPQTAELEGAAVDLDRQRRCGFPEVVFAEGKPAELVADIMQRLVAAGQSAFATRASDEQAQAVNKRLPQAQYDSVSRTIHVPVAAAPESDGQPQQPQVAVVSAGSCDAPVAKEAVATLNWMGVPCRLIEDVGVAGPQRLLQHVPFLQRMKVVVCVAGMEAALPSVLGGHVGCPVIGVPTSVGYGASLNGITALLSMMTCCASNVVTVNIDAGFRGGYVAGMMVRQMTTGQDAPAVAASGAVE